MHEASRWHTFVSVHAGGSTRQNLLSVLLINAPNNLIAYDISQVWGDDVVSIHQHDKNEANGAISDGMQSPLMYIRRFGEKRWTMKFNS
jgi:hypothetical protein